MAAHTQNTEQLRRAARQLQRDLAENGYVLVSHAAKMLNVPLATLAEAARNQKIPAIEVLPRRWFVSLAEARARYAPASESNRNDLLRRLEAMGVITPRPKRVKRGLVRPKAINPASKKTLAEMVIEDRE